MRLRRRHDEPYEFAALATYNGEVARGIVHTREYAEAMRQEQERFDRQRWPHENDCKVTPGAFHMGGPCRCQPLSPMPRSLPEGGMGTNGN